MFRLIYNKKLLVDSSTEEFARVRANLDEKNIPCYIKTKKVPNNTAILLCPIVSEICHVLFSAKTMSYVYYIYVKRRL